MAGRIVTNINHGNDWFLQMNAYQTQTVIGTTTTTTDTDFTWRIPADWVAPVDYEQPNTDEQRNEYLPGIQ